MRIRKSFSQNYWGIVQNLEFSWVKSQTTVCWIVVLEFPLLQRISLKKVWSLSGKAIKNINSAG